MYSMALPENHAQQRLTAKVLKTSVVVSGTPPYFAGDIRNAYGIDLVSPDGISGLTGQHYTIAIVEAYGNGSMASDLSQFDSIMGLPDCNLTISGSVNARVASETGWDVETALDVEWAHAMAPGANILLVVASSDSASALLHALGYASAHADIVSMSWGGAETGAFEGYFTPSATHPVAFVAASGDSGGGTSWPASSPNVIGVGGTTLNYVASRGQWSEQAWGGSGGGRSRIFPEPSYQKYIPPQPSDSVTLMGVRGTPDVSLVADPNTGVIAVAGGGQYQVGGTSLSTAMWAGILALSNQYREITNNGKHSPLTSAQFLTKLYWLAFNASGTTKDYSLAGWTTAAVPNAYFFDVTTGPAGPEKPPGTKYDFATGIGTPFVDNLVKGLR